MVKAVRADYTPPLGDLRVMGLGDQIWVYPGASNSKDWSRLQDAIGAAVARGAEVLQKAA